MHDPVADSLTKSEPGTWAWEITGVTGELDTKRTSTARKQEQHIPMSFETTESLDPLRILIVMVLAYSASRRDSTRLLRFSLRPAS